MRTRLTAPCALLSCSAISDREEYPSSPNAGMWMNTSGGDAVVVDVVVEVLSLGLGAYSSGLSHRARMVRASSGRYCAQGLSICSSTRVMDFAPGVVVDVEFPPTPFLRS